MNDGDVGARDFVDGDIARAVLLVARIRQEEKVSAIESRFHRSTVDENKDYSGDFQPGFTTHLNTTTMGDSELVMIPNPFQIMRPDAMTDAKFKICRRT